MEGAEVKANEEACVACDGRRWKRVPCLACDLPDALFALCRGLDGVPCVCVSDDDDSEEVATLTQFVYPPTA